MGDFSYVQFDGSQVKATDEVRSLRAQRSLAKRIEESIGKAKSAAMGDRLRVEERLAYAEWMLMPEESRPPQYWRCFDAVCTGYGFGFGRVPEK